MRIQQAMGLAIALAGLGIEVWLAVLVNSGDGAQTLLIHIGMPWTLILSAAGVLGLACGAALYVAPAPAGAPPERAPHRRERSFRPF
jgi:hypothetical protein